MPQGKHAKIEQPETARSLERKMLTAVGYPLAFAALCSLACGPGYALAIEATGGSSSDSGSATGDAIVSDQASNAPAPSAKDETVYAFSKPDGEVKNIEVSARLSNPDGNSELADSSTLKNIENVEGDESYRGFGSGMVWDAQGNDIYYRGDSSDKLPVNLKVTYKLNGRTIAPENLKGQSGEVVIRYDYENTSKTTANVNGAAETIYTPFVAVTGMLLDNDLFSDISVENGRVIDDGDRTVVVGYALPGMQESLGVNRDDIDVPDYFEVKAKATGFEMSSTLTMVSAGLFDGMSLSDFNTDELSDASLQLEDAMSQLQDGSGKLVEGLAALADGAGDAKDASGKLADGAGQLADGASQLADGTAAMKNQAGALPDGVNQLATGADALSTGLPSAADAAGQLADGAGTLSAGLNSAVTGADQLIAGADQLNAGLGQLVGDGSAANPGLTAVEAGATQLARSLDAAKTEMKAAADGQAKVVQGVDGAKQSMQGAIQIVAQLAASGALSADSAHAITDVLDKGITFADETHAGASQIKEGLDAAVADDGAFDQAIAGAKQLAVGTQTAIDAIQTRIAQGVGSLKYGLVVLKSGDGVSNAGLQGAAAGSAQIASGASQLKGDDSSGLVFAANGAKQLSDGLNQLRSKIPALISGVTQIATGSDKLKDGSDTLAKSLEKFDSALEQLAAGAASAADGSDALDEGLQKFGDEGIAKITDLIDGDLMSATDRIDALKEAGENYTNFSGITEGTDGSVKFVYEVDAIE